MLEQQLGPGVELHECQWRLRRALVWATSQPPNALPSTGIAGVTHVPSCRSWALSQSQVAQAPAALSDLMAPTPRGHTSNGEWVRARHGCSLRTHLQGSFEPWLTCPTANSSP